MVSRFARSYEPTLRDHIEALRQLVTPRPDDPEVATIIGAAETVAVRLRRAADDPSSVRVGSRGDLMELSTSPELAERLTAFGLRSC
jgi:hypothetical protein